jgi:formamidopyrimidine-DNA glycosylase
MPELPEVETIRRVLTKGNSEENAIPGNTITGCRVLWAKSIAIPDAAAFTSMVTGQTFGRIGRRGKYLIFHLTKNKLLVHLRMSGDLFTDHVNDPLNKHSRVYFELDKKNRLVFTDTRKFGRMWLVEDESDVLVDLGPEPLDDDFTSGVFGRRLKRYRRQLKPLLLDQKFIAGMGNIYTDEALFRAKIHPMRISNTLSDGEIKKLFKSLRDVLREGIERCGSSIDWVYRGGDFQNYFNVYQQDGQPCPDCGTEIQKLSVAQRGTHICPECQMLEKQ